MKITWLVPDDHGGGIVSVALSCVRQAHAAGHEATLLMLFPPTGWFGEGEQNGFTLASLGIEGDDRDAPAAILRWLDTHPQDVLVLNACDQANSIIPYLPASVRCVYTVHDTAPGYWQAAVQYEADLDAIVAVSQVVANQFEDQLQGLAPLHVVHNGSIFPAPPVSQEGRSEDLIFLCGNNPAKGAHDLLKLWTALVDGGFGGALHWFGHMDLEFTRRVESLPAAERIHLYGRTPRAKIFAVAANCRVFLMLSRVEPFGMVTIETMSMGCVPVAWNIEAGTREIVCEGETGYFVALGDFPALLQAVEKASANQPMMGKAAMDRARQDFNEETMWRGYARVAAEVAAQPSRHRSLAGQEPTAYVPPRRYFQILPPPIRRLLRDLAGRSPRLGYWVGNLRGR